MSYSSDNNNSTVPSFTKNNFQTGINIRITTLDYNKLGPELQKIIYKYLLSTDTDTQNGHFKFIDTGRLEMFLLLLKDFGYTHRLNWEEFDQKNEKIRAQYFNEKFKQFQSLQLYMIDLYQGFQIANRVYGQLITQRNILTPQQVWFIDVYEEIMRHANEIGSNPPRESIYEALRTSPGNMSNVFGLGRKNNTIAKLRHYNRKIARLLAEL